MTLTKTGVRVVAAAVISAAISGSVFYFLWVAPGSTRSDKTRAELSAVTARLTRLVQANPQLVKLQKSLIEERAGLVKAKEAWTKSSSQVRTDEEAVRLLNGEWMANASGFSKPMVTRTSRTESGVTAKSTYMVGVEGSYARLAEYLDALERSWPLVRVNSARLTRKDGTGAWRERLDCEIETFTSRLPRDGASPDKNLSPRNEFLRTPFGFFKVIGASPAPGTPSISSILFRGKGRYVLSEGKAFREGDALPGGYVVKEIAVDRAVLSRAGLDVVLTPTA